MKMIDVQLFLRWTWQRVKCAFGGHGPGTYETSSIIVTRAVTFDVIATHCADCGKIIQRDQKR